MIGFGSQNFGQSNFGYGIGYRTVDEVNLTSSMDVAGYLTFNTCTAHNQTASTVSAASGLLQGANSHLNGTSIVTVAGIKMIWHPHSGLNLVTPSVQSSGKLAWDGQNLVDASWTTQTIGD